MRELVRQDDLDFVVRVVGEHRVGHEDPPRRAEPRERGVRLLGLVAQAPLVRAEHARARPLGERQQPRAQRIAIERLDPVEQRQQHHRRQIRQADDQQREDRAGRQPPSAWRQADEEVDQRWPRRRRAPGRRRATSPGPAAIRRIARSTGRSGARGRTRCRRRAEAASLVEERRGRRRRRRRPRAGTRRAERSRGASARSRSRTLAPVTSSADEQRDAPDQRRHAIARRFSRW